MCFCLNAHHARVRGTRRRRRSNNRAESQAPKRKLPIDSNRKWGHSAPWETLRPRLWGDCCIIIIFCTGLGKKNRNKTHKACFTHFTSAAHIYFNVHMIYNRLHLDFFTNSTKVFTSVPLCLPDRKGKTEYRSNFRSPLQYSYRDGAWAKIKTAKEEVSFWKKKKSMGKIHRKLHLILIWHKKMLNV